MKRVLRVYSDGQEEIVVIRGETRRQLNWPLIAGLTFALAVWAAIISVFA